MTFRKPNPMTPTVYKALGPMGWRTLKADTLAAAKREATRAFGDGVVLGWKPHWTPKRVISLARRQGGTWAWLKV